MKIEKSNPEDDVTIDKRITTHPKYKDADERKQALIDADSCLFTTFLGEERAKENVDDSRERCIKLMKKYNLSQYCGISDIMYEENAKEMWRHVDPDVSEEKARKDYVDWMREIMNDPEWDSKSWTK